jgi:diguanylate cyclase (GGDEF)-like protein
LGKTTEKIGMLGRLLARDVFAPAVALALATVLLLLGALFYVAHDADTAAVLHDEAVVANGLNVRLLEVVESAVQSADDVAEAGLQPTLHFSALVSAGGHTLQAFEREQAASPEAVAEFRAAAEELVDTVRRMAQSSPARPANVIQSSAIAVVDGRAFVLAATLLPGGPGAPVLLTAEEIDDAFVAVIGDRFLLDGLRLQRGVHAASSGQARVAIADANGAEIAALVWQPRTPGAELLRKALPPVGVLIAILVIIGVVLYRRGQEAARKLKASEARATHLAYHDALTGLPNRLMFNARLALAMEELRRRGAHFAVHCIDLDRFKEVNDTFGHQVGDELIRLAARRIGDSCRSVDTVARLGGDEFAIVQSGTESMGASQLAERLIQSLSAPMDLSVGRVHIGASVGIVLVTEATDPQDCLRQADLALYRVKESGRGAYSFFEEEMDATVRFRRGLQADLHQALQEETLELHYQPQVDGAGRIVGLEALLRWAHPTRGAVSPSVFIPIAEECGLIDRLGFFTLRRAFEDSRRWPHLRVAINISAVQLRIRGFTEHLAELIVETGVDPYRFELEITEGVLLGDDPQTHETLKQIRDLGFSLALDDFGTGYSSLSYLQRYPVSKIKIDRSFVANLGVDREGEAVVAAIVRLARALRLSVIAEGVETNEQRLRLARAGCSEVQGFLFGRPAAPEAIEAILAEQCEQDTRAQAG